MATKPKPKAIRPRTNGHKAPPKKPTVFDVRAQRRATAFTAAATRILPNDEEETAKLRKRRQAWQEQAWDYFDLVGEIKYACTFVGNAMSKLRIFAAEIDDPEDEPTATQEPAAIEAVERLRSPVAGHSEIMRNGGINLMVAGECYLVGVEIKEDPDPASGLVKGDEVWDIRSFDEITPGSDGKFVMRDIAGVQSPVPLSDDDFICRIWLRHPRFSHLADSSVRGVLSSAEELIILERAIRAAGRSRITGPGILLVPSELSFGESPDPTEDPGDGEAAIDPFIAELLTAMMTPIQNEGDASAVVPMVIRGAAEHLKELRHVILDRPMDAMLDQRTERAQRRLAQGLDVPPEVVLGTADVNHWTSWQIDEATFRGHIEPKCLTLLDAITQGYLVPYLKEAGVPNPERYVIWYDATKLVVRPNRGEDAKFAYGAKAISGKALLRALDFSEKDIPDAKELQERLILEGTRMDPFVQAQILRDTIAPNIQIPLPMGGVEGKQGPGDTPGPKPDTTPPPPAKPNVENPVPPAPTGKQPANPGPASAVTAAGAKNIGTRLAEMDRLLRERIRVAADAAMRRALERVGAALRSKAKKDKHLSETITDVQQDEVAKVLGPTIVKSLGLDEQEMLRGTFEPLGKRVLSWVGTTQRQALGLLNLPEHVATSVAAQQVTDRAEAVEWMKGALYELAHKRIYDPAPPAPEHGEYDPTMSVPFGLVRATVARAGGAKRLVGVTAAAELPGGGYGVFTPTGAGDSLVPAGGIGTGDLIGSVLGDAGLAVEGFEWDYGAYMRAHPFEPHEALDGEPFQNFDDDVLANNTGWPETDYYLPGDHDGCMCDFNPVIIEGTDAVDEAAIAEAAATGIEETSQEIADRAASRAQAVEETIQQVAPTRPTARQIAARKKGAQQ